MNCDEFLTYFERGFRSFHKTNIESVGQRAAKLLAVKFGSLKKNSATSDSLLPV